MRAKLPRTLNGGGGSGRASSACLVVLSAFALVSCGDAEDEAQSGGNPAVPPAAPASPQSQNDQGPTLSGTPSTQVLVGNLYDFLPTAADPNGDTLSFTIQNRPSWATFDSANGRLSGTPNQADVGEYSDVRIRVSDGRATAALVAFSVSVISTASGSATLSWMPPMEKTDGSPLTVAGYKIYWGTSSGSYSHSATLNNPGLVTYVVEELTPARWYFAVTAYDGQAAESEFSNEAFKDVL